MIRCALAEIFSLPTSIPRRLRPSISSSKIRGSRTTPLPITQTLSEWRIPDGIRWNLNFSPSRTIVWPALLPPWKRTITSVRSASRSVTLPLPSSPHWAPTITKPGMAAALCRFGRLGDLAVAAIVAEERHLVADLAQARDRATADLLLEFLVGKVGRDQDRALRLIALV